MYKNTILRGILCCIIGGFIVTASGKKPKESVIPSYIVMDTITFFDENEIHTKAIRAYNKDIGKEVWEEFYKQNGKKRWIPSSRGIYQYTPQGDITNETYFVWDAKKKLWSPDERFITQYDSQKRETEKIGSEYLKERKIWQERQKVTYEYNPKGEKSSVAYYFQDETSNGWIGDTKIISYTNDKGTTDMVDQMKWDPAQKNWRPASRIISLFNDKGTKIAEESHTWGISSGKFFPTWKKTFEYDAQNRQTEKDFYRWNEQQNQWILFR